MTPEIWEHLPTRVEVYPYDGTNGRAIAESIDDIRVCEWDGLTLAVYNGQAELEVNVGDYVVVGVGGLVYPMLPDVFLASYRRVA